VKRVINLAEVDKKTIDLRIAIPAILLILAAAFAFSKFAVADRLIAVSRAECEVAAVQRELDDAYRRLDSFGELTELYAHYTYSGMTDEEVHRTDRAEILNLLRKVVLPDVAVDSWNVKGNVLNITMTADTLEDINRNVQKINGDELVDFCTVNNAKTNETRRTLTRGDREETIIETSVTAQVVAYLNPDEGVDRR
jgi:hypothetical protein